MNSSRQEWRFCGRAGAIRRCHDTSTKNAGGACNHGSSRCRPWATTNAHADTSGPSSRWAPNNAAVGPPANAAATFREAAATSLGTPSLALVTRSLALEWPSLGLGAGAMAVVAVQIPASQFAGCPPAPKPVGSDRLESPGAEPWPERRRLRDPVPEHLVSVWPKARLTFSDREADVIRQVILVLALAATPVLAPRANENQRPFSCRLLTDEQRKCAFGNCDQRTIGRLMRECLRDGGSTMLFPAPAARERPPPKFPT